MQRMDTSLVCLDNVGYLYTDENEVPLTPALMNQDIFLFFPNLKDIY